jgi:hypothetical protein
MVAAMLDEQRPEDEYRAPKKAFQITKYDTGEVGEMAFGFKARKVNMMRGNRQGNNAFLEDAIQTHKTPLDYLINSGAGTLEEAFGYDTVNEDTLKALSKVIRDEKFLKFVEDKLVRILMKKGCTKTLKNLFSVFGISEDKPTFFNKINYTLLFSH